MAMLDRLGETGQLQITAIPAGQLDTREYTIPLNSWQSSSAAPDPLGSLGIVQFDIPPVLDTIVAGGAAEQAGLMSGDRIISADGQDISRRGRGHPVPQSLAGGLSGFAHVSQRRVHG